MSKKIEALLKEKKKVFCRYLTNVASVERKLLVKGDLLEILRKMEKKNGKSFDEIRDVVSKIMESVSVGSSLFFEMREKIGLSSFHQFNTEDCSYERIGSVEYLKAKERYKDPKHTNDLLTLNFHAFYEQFPSIHESKNIGRGVEYLNRYLSSKLFTNTEKMSEALFNFLFVHKHNSEQLVLNDRIKDTEGLTSSINKGIRLLSEYELEEPYNNIKHKLQELGFEPGLGNTAGTIKEGLEQLDALINTPDHEVLKSFLSRIPMIFNIAIITPHGYFAQEDVLGKPDTGGQIVYILDQVKALEKNMNKSLEDAGIETSPKIIILTRLIPNSDGTSCNQRMEKVHNTKNVWILRVPFRDHNKKVTDNWISRFEIWPYLEEFAEDSYKELLVEFGTRPDLVIGNYSDGNLVASILTKRFGVTQCNVAHALEKSKYLYSGLYWKEMEEQYHFSTQFTADLLAMNAADFIITSTYQEIAGREDSIGQYESYVNFTMPGLYRVSGGVNIFNPKFNILPPGVNAEVFFPYHQQENRVKEMTEEVAQKLFITNSERIIGELKNPDLPPIFSMARLDKIKNLTSLVKWFGESEELQSLANLIIVAGKINAEHSTDSEEKEQVRLMHEYINKYNLKDKIRWIQGDADRQRVPEFYRLIADKRGVFVQPALFEGFGLTVIEAMRSGLPTFATQYGGPLEIIENKVSGFHIDPINGNETTEKLVNFFKRCKEEENYWKKISDAGITRVDKSFNWELYSQNLLSLAKIYGFWRYTTNLEMTELNAYLDLMYHTLYKPRAEKILEMHAGK
ncbi:MAG: sucrose synthase [Ignavibacteriaceae bacterium]|nr:sucrose synthase [Ignavibacteriaceae bacterium]